MRDFSECCNCFRLVETSAGDWSALESWVRLTSGLDRNTLWCPDCFTRVRTEAERKKRLAFDMQNDPSKSFVGVEKKQ